MLLFCLLCFAVLCFALGFDFWFVFFGPQPPVGSSVCFELLSDLTDASLMGTATTGALVVNRIARGVRVIVVTYNCINSLTHELSLSC